MELINYYLEPVLKKWINPGKRTKLVSSVIIFVLFLVSWYLVNCFGRENYIHLHLLYISVIIAALIFKLKGGVIAGIIGGAIIGPIMNLELKGSAYKIDNWMGGFILPILVGVISGIILSILSKKIKQLARHGYYNQLTNLPNRQMLHNDLERIIEADFIDDRSFVLAVVSIDNFADIFNIIGYQQSDSFLQKLSSHFENHLNKNIKLYHVHSNKFNILLLRYSKLEALKWCKDFSAFLEESIQFNDIPIYLKTSIGLAHYPDHSADGDEVINKSYIAMNKARDHGLTYRWYHKALDKISRHNFLLLGDVKRALREDEFELHYQPKVNIKEDKIVGLEALIRWDHLGDGYIPPNQFIPQIEQTGLINSLTAWVLNQSIKDCLSMREAGYKTKVAINITARNLHDPEFLVTVKDILGRYNINPKFLEFEITERDLMKKFVKTKKVLNDLVDLGITISLDDFGTGYSSLAYLKYLPTKIIKIDRAFIKDVLVDEKDKVITKTAVKMGHLLNRTVVAEGVESAEAIEVLKKMDCDVVQGYYISKPKPLAELSEWFENSKWKI